MGNTTPDNITYPDLPMPVGALNAHLATLAQSVQTALTATKTLFNGKFTDLYALPKPVTSTGAALTNITATAFAAVPSVSAITINFTRPAWVQVNLSFWGVASVGDEYVGINVTGATLSAPAEPVWGASAYVAAVAGTQHRMATKTILCNAGSTTFTAQAYQTGGGVKRVNNSLFQVIPLRWNAGS